MAICLKPQRIINPRYKKDGRKPFEYRSFPDYYLEVPCRLCINCIKNYQSEWRVRLLAEWNYSPPEVKERTYFLTFTINSDWISFCQEFPEKAVKWFRDEYRRLFKCSCRYWMITEFGETTGRFHFHAILFGCKASKEQLESIWKFGFIKRKPCTTRRISYITKYITKVAEDVFIDKSRLQKVFCSPGIGKKYAEDINNVRYAHPSEGRFNLTVHNFGMPYKLPRYLQNKIFSEDELRLIKFDRQIFMSIPKPPYRVGKFSFGTVESFTKYLLTNYNVLHPLFIKNYEYQKQISGLS